MAARTQKPKQRKKREITKVEDLKNKKEDFIECYDVGHSWARLGYFKWERSGICRRFFCTRCTTERDDYFYRTSRMGFGFSHRRYFYPEGYLKQGTGIVSKIDVQNEAIRRIIKGGDLYGSADEVPESPFATASR